MYERKTSPGLPTGAVTFARPTPYYTEKDPFDGSGSGRNGDAGRTEPVAQQSLCDQATEGVPNDARRNIQPAYDLLVVIDNLDNSERCDC